MSDPCLEKYKFKAVLCKYPDPRVSFGSAARDDVVHWMVDTFGTFDKDWFWTVDDNEYLCVYANDLDKLMTMKLTLLD